MYVKLLTDREYRGKKYKAGDTIEVSDSLGGSMILNGIAVRAVKPEQVDFLKMKKDEIVAYAGEHGIDLPSKATKDEIIAILQEA